MPGWHGLTNCGYLSTQVSSGTQWKGCLLMHFNPDADFEQLDTLRKRAMEALAKSSFITEIGEVLGVGWADAL